MIVRPTIPSCHPKLVNMNFYHHKHITRAFLVNNSAKNSFIMNIKNVDILISATVFKSQIPLSNSNGTNFPLRVSPMVNSCIKILVNCLLLIFSAVTDYYKKRSC